MTQETAESKGKLQLKLVTAVLDCELSNEEIGQLLAKCQQILRAGGSWPAARTGLADNYLIYFDSG